MDNVQEAFSSALQAVDDRLRTFDAQIAFKEVGVVSQVLNGIAKVSGLPHVGFEELVRFSGGSEGFVCNLEEDEVGVALLGETSSLHVGMEVERTGRVVDVPVGEKLLGRVIDPLGNPLDEKREIEVSQRFTIEREAPQIVDRLPVTVPLQTGIKVIDALIPIGHGQRELILGDRQIGKTAIAVDTIINQRGKGVICVYCAIGRRSSAVAKVIADLAEKNAMEYTVVMVAEGNDAPGVRYIAPYAATSIAEYFMLQGKKVLIVYDDLSSHARAYRELSLLLRRLPGREAFPGDIFYIHAKLLERATHLSEELGGGSLTALPLVQTEEEDISAYIPTNLISITDGQIFLSTGLFEKWMLPAVDVGKSVSRVGGKAQLAAFREVSGSLKLSYEQFEELEAFTRFDTQLDDVTRKTLRHGQRIRWCLTQNRLDPYDVITQLYTLLSFTHGLFDEMPIEDLPQGEKKLRETVHAIPESIRADIMNGKSLSPEMQSVILACAREALGA